MIEVDNVKNEPSLREIFNFWTWQRQKRSNSAILPRFFRSWQHQKRSNSARLPSKMENWVQSGRPRTNAFCDFFQSICLNYCACHEKLMPGHTKCGTCQGKIISANLKIWCSKMQPFSGNQRPDLLKGLMNMSLVLRLPRKMHPCRSSSNVPRLPSFVEMLRNPHVFAHFWEGAQSLAPATRKQHLNLQKSRKTCGDLYILTSKCASRHHGVHFFWHLNFQKWSDNGVFCTFWLRNVLGATTACTFSTSQLPKVVRPWCVLYILTWKCASRHNGVHFFDISTSKSGPRMACFAHFDFEMCSTPPQRRAIFSSLIWPDGSTPRRFSEPTFRPSGATNHWKKHSVSRLSYLFAHLHLLSSDSFSSLIFSLLIFLFSLCLCPTLLFICPYCRKFDF